MVSRRDLLKAVTLPALGAGRTGQKRNCIFLALTGGPSQLDTWDPKPDAPSSVRGPYRPIKTSVAGIEIAEIFPRMARQAHHYALIRSCYSNAEPLHEIGLRQMRPAGQVAVPGACRDARYGRNRFGQSVLEARRLIESGATQIVTVDMFDTVFGETSWDIHGWAPFSRMRCYAETVGPMFDKAYSTLIEDLDRNGLLSTTLVVATGEFGRTPRINPAGGRDHWTQCWTVLMAGGGVRGGHVIGESDKIAAEPRQRPVSTAEVSATIDYALGIETEQGARPVMELFS